MGKSKSKSVLLVMAACVLMGWCNAKDAWKNDAKVIKVGGKVMCQDCSKSWNEWAHASTPLKGCKVAITCMERGRVVYYGSDETDEEGDYEIDLTDSINGKKLNSEECVVRLMSSPHPQCSILTDFGHGRSGVKLSRPNLVYRDTVKYMLGPFYFTSPMCEEPDATPGGESEEKGNNY